eukprot:snap_masked-scaffold464_size163657-processed-gene-0.15 protein:Tk05278 transcript:snap_masked-scaffold464_size163657-processed-gene-0.15-mRNA-1 annotation:"nuclear receptor subfamily 1 group i member 2-like"
MSHFELAALAMDEAAFDDLLAMTSDESQMSSMECQNSPSSMKGPRNCDVCTILIDTKHASIHYGALTCYSCRAFFRRSLQKTRKPEFKCFKVGDCDITPKSRRKCQKCRFQKCLEVGMKIEMVLTDTQKERRFRKFLAKKRKHSNSQEPSSGDSSCPSEDFYGLESTGFANEQRRISHENACLLSKFQEFHTGAASLSQREFQGLLGVLTLLFRSFAQTLPEFRSLTVDEQTTLIDANKHSFLAYLLARYFMSVSGQEQLEWLFGTGISGSHEKGLLYYIPLQSYIDLYQVFSWTNPSGLKVFFDLSAALRRYDIDFGSTGSIAQCLLFTSDLEQPWSSSQPVSPFEKYKANLQATYKDNPVQRLLDIIQDLQRTLVSHSTALVLPEDAKVDDKNLTLDPWLQTHLEKVREAFRQAPYGPDLINDMIMHSYGVPVSKSFLPQSIQVWLNRARLLILSEPNVGLLEQEKLIEDNCFKFAALHFSMLESFSSGSEQLTFAAGDKDIEVWEEKYKPYVQESSFHPLLIKETQADMSQGELEHILHLQAKVAKTLLNTECFVIFSFVVLFSEVEGVVEVFESHLRVWNERTLGRSASPLGDAKALTERLEDVKELGRLLKVVHSRSDLKLELEEHQNNVDLLSLEDSL